MDSPIVMGSVFKSGTWLLRHMIERLAGLKPVEPDVKAGPIDPADPRYVFCQHGHFYSWHFIPTREVCDKLKSMGARPVFLVRNVYDLAVSMYYHFADDVDADIGRGAGKRDYFRALGKDEAMARVICGSDDPAFRWKGIGLHLWQMECMLRCSNEMPTHVVSYERLTGDKRHQIKSLAAFLGITELDERQVEVLVESSSFDSMRSAAKRTGAGSHFRKGRAGSHADELKPEHIEQIEVVMTRDAPWLRELAANMGFAEIVESRSPGRGEDGA